jgi:hypothetical protein
MKTILILISFLFATIILWGQMPDEMSYTCAICEEGIDIPTDFGDCTHSSLMWSSNDLYIPGENYESINVRVNFIFLHKSDGTGMFIEGDPEHDQLIADLIDRTNQTFNDLINPTNPAIC